MTTPESRYTSDENFFVGYKAMPATLRWRHRLVAIAFVMVLAAMAVFTAYQQRSAGTGVWQTGELTTLEGLLVADPYPLLHTVTAEGNSQSVLLIQPGKFSATALASPHTGKMVEISGYTISRGGWRMLEVPDAASIVVSADTDTLQPPAAEALGSITLDGEVVDSKCFLGVMKPGDGPIHRACAELCMLGGVPPMFVASDTGGRKYGYLLVTPDGFSLSTDMAAHAAQPMRISGELQQRGDLLYIQATVDDLIALGSPVLQPAFAARKTLNAHHQSADVLSTFLQRNGPRSDARNDMCRT